MLEELGCAIGKGLLSGLAGTAAITGAQRIEMRLTGRQPSSTPEKAGGAVLGVEPTNEAGKRFGTMVHWFYGTVWGIPLGLLRLSGLRKCMANAVHFLAIWLTGMILLPALKASSAPWKWGVKALAIDGLLHIVYAAASGLFHEWISPPRK
ncbi:MAG: hypothetical protein GF344_15955 [Chitinivibrionales bacterium]|nr:hypothetical protein [Chitinivibrionales bacterium]MBD3358189.1 hypothetical protein [Chitinivibrionales bacterium]